MLDHDAAHLALRTRARSLVVITTGAISLSATSTGYARAAGSFLTDGFFPGMEILAAGFGTAANNGYSVVKDVVALALTVEKSGGTSTEGAGAGRSLVVGLPGVRAWENFEPIDGSTPVQAPISGRPLLEEDFVPGSKELLGVVQQGVVEYRGLYVLRWYGLAGYGSTPIRKATDALLALFPIGLGLIAGAHSLRIQGKPSGPSASQIRPVEGGWSLSTVTIPWRAFTHNPAT